MRTIEYDISSINLTEKDFFIDMLSYVSEHIVDYEFDDNSITIEIKDDKYYDDVIRNIEQLRQMINNENFEQDEQLETKVIFDSSNIQTINKEPIFDKLLESQNVVLVMPGVYGYSDLVWNICKYFIKKVKDFLHTQFSEYKEIKFPKLYPIDEFKQSGYFEKFPHHIMFQSVLKNDINTINEFSKIGVNERFLANIKTPNSVLKNASCVPIYPMIANNKYENQQTAKVFYVTGKCFRNEGANIEELNRLNEFTMSEIVFIGTDELIREGIARAKRLWEFWIKIFNLNCKIETANDSFFAGNYKKLKFFQLIGNAKEEFKLLLPHSDKYIAAASANYHRTQFTKRYNIKSDKGYCHSACIAFGIERLTYALLCQKGIDIDKWDQATIDEVSKYIALNKYMINL
jgi:hypothetical protein